MTRLSVCSLGVSCNEMNDTPMLLVVPEMLIPCDEGNILNTFRVMIILRLLLLLRIHALVGHGKIAKILIL